MIALLFALVCAGLAGRASAQGRDISVGAFVNSLSAINPADGSYSISLDLWFVDPEGKFDPRDDLYILGRSVSISQYYREVGADGSAYVSVRADAVIEQEYDLTEFPFDEQRLVLRMEIGEPLGQIRLVPATASPKIADYVHLSDWNLGPVSLTETEHQYDFRFGLEEKGPETFSQLELTIHAARVQTGIVIDDFLGYIFSFIITGLIYFVPTSELGTRIGMTTGSLFAALLNLNRLLDAGGYKAEFGLVEKLGFLLFGAILCSLVISIAMKRVSVKQGVEVADRIDAALGAGVMLVFLAAIIWVLRAGMT